MQQERHSFFRPLNPLKRGTSSLRYACTGLKSSCELCPSFSPISRIKECDIGVWLVDPDGLGELGAATATHNWLVPANMDFFTTDVSGSIVDDIFTVLKEEDRQQFFVVSRNPPRMRRHWFDAPHIYWGYSASTQEELDFYAQTRFPCEENFPVKEVLFLDPLIEEIVLPPILLHHFEFIFIDGYRGNREIEFQLEWIESVQSQLDDAVSSTKLVVEGLGDRPMHRDLPYKTKRKKFYDLPIENLI